MHRETSAGSLRVVRIVPVVIAFPAVTIAAVTILVGAVVGEGASPAPQAPAAIGLIADGGVDATAAGPAFPDTIVPLVAGPRRVVSAETQTDADHVVTERRIVFVRPAVDTWRRGAAMALLRAGFVSTGRVRAHEEQPTQVWMSRGPVTVHYRARVTASDAIVYAVQRRLVPRVTGARG